MRLGRLLGIGALGVGAAVATGACLGATQVMVHVTTDATCTSTPGSVHFVALGIATGVPGKVNIGLPNGTSTKCGPLTEALGEGYGPSNLGTLALVPGGAKDGPIEVVVVATVDSPTLQGIDLNSCLAWAQTQMPAVGFRNAADPDTSKPVMPCLVARRSLTFTAHESFELPIQLDATCAGTNCDPGYTCVNQTCVQEHTVCNAAGSKNNCMLGGTGGAGTTTGPMTTSTTSSKATTSSAMSTSATMSSSTSVSTGSAGCCAFSNCGLGAPCNPATCMCKCTTSSCATSAVPCMMGGTVETCEVTACKCECDANACKAYCLPKVGVCSGGINTICACS